MKVLLTAAIAFQIIYNKHVLLFNHKNTVSVILKIILTHSN